MKRASSLRRRHVPALVALLLMAIAAITPAMPVFAEGAGRSVNLGDYFRVKRIDDPRISPDGALVAFVEISPDVKSDRFRSSVQVVSTKQDRGSRVAVDAGETFMPRWTADGNRLGYLKVGESGIELVSLTAAEAALGSPNTRRSIATLPGAPIDFAWSPDGRRIAVLVRLGVPLRRSQAAQAPAGATWTEGPLIYSSPAFQQVNEMLPKTANDFAIFVVETEGGEQRRLTTSGSLGENLPYTKPDIVWAPDGTSVMVSLNRAEKGYLNIIQGNLFAIDAQSGVIRHIAGQEGGAYFNPSFASDGTMGFSCRPPTRENLIRFEFCVGKGSGPFDSAAPTIESMIYPAKLAPDGNGFFGVFTERGKGKLAWFGPKGAPEVLAETGGGDANAYVDGGALTVAKDGTVAFLLSNERVPSALAIVRRGRPSRVLVDPNKDYIAGRAVSVARELSFKPTDGSAEVGAFLFEPTGGTSKAKPPGIVMLHGGQSSDYGPDFDLAPQVFAAHGYKVILPNYRGSGTYGRAFANASTGSPADREFDVLGAADALIAAGADADRIYLMGGSGGGMITGWTISRTNRFRAAVMWYPTTEWWIFAMDSAVGPTTLTSFRQAPWEDPAEYISRSPYAQIGKIETPTMLIVGENDRITPPSGSMAFFRGLRVRGIDAELVIYPGAAHGIDSIPSQAMGHIAETLGWLERHGGAKLQQPELPQVGPK